MLNEFRNADTHDLDIDELIAFCSFGRSIMNEYDASKIVAPIWLLDRLRNFKREIKFKEQDAKSMRLRTAKAELEKLRTTEEQRASLATEIAELEGADKEG